MAQATTAATVAATSWTTWSESLNTRWHRLGLRIFMVVVAFHWLEHIVQAWQAFVLHWPRPMSMGFVGMYFPWLMRTEVFHYGFALVMLVFLWVLRTGFAGRAYTWWMISFWLQFWHHIEHGLLFYQALSGRYLFGGTVPTSIGQIWIPRIELHLFYNTVVFIPMMVGLYYHLHPSSAEAAVAKCTCAHSARMATA